MKYMKNSHCSFCGTGFGEGVAWPRRCGLCGNVTYVNPIPVAVVLQPVDEGVLVVRRDIEPRRGELALPGGFMDGTESWNAAGARELLEETGIVVEPEMLELFAVHSTGNGMLLVFALAPRLASADLPLFEANREVSEVVIISEAMALAFPLHTLVVAAFFG